MPKSFKERARNWKSVAEDGAIIQVPRDWEHSPTTGRWEPPMTYRVVFKHLRTDEYILVGTAKSLAEAKELRRVSGDLVFGNDGKIVKDLRWLWDWELNSESSWAQEMIQTNPKLGNCIGGEK